MKKRIIAWAVLLSVCAAALGLWCSAAVGKTARTLPCEDEGLILSITTSYYKRVVFIDRSPAVCYTVWDAVDW